MQVELINQKWYQPPLIRILEDLKLGEFEIPKDFISDGVSVPRISMAIGCLISVIGFYALKSLLLVSTGLFMIYMPTIFNRFGDGLRATILHDYLLKKMSRTVADAHFYKQLERDGIGYLRRNLMWAVVRIYGRFK